MNIRCVNHQSVPLPFDVLLRRLLADIQAIKLQLPGNFFLTLEDHQRDLSSAALTDLCSVFFCSSKINFMKRPSGAATLRQ